jgi:O-antigen/teichoic acid export membrane protein
MGHDTVVNKAVSSSAKVAARGVAIRAIGLGANLVLARMLAPEDFGLAALGFTILGFAMFLTDGGVGAGFIRRTGAPSRLELESILGFQLSMTVAISAITLLVGLAFGDSGRLVFVMVASLYAVSFQAPGAILLERNLDFGRRVVVEITESLCFAVVAITAVAMGFGVWGIAVAMVVRGIVGAITMNLVTPIRILRPRFNIRAIRGVLAFGLKFQAAAATNLVRDQGINLGLAALGGVGVLGLWSLAYRILQLPNVVFESLWRVSFPTMSRLEESGYNSAAVLKRLMNLVSLTGGLVIVSLAASSHDLLGVAFGDRWQPGSSVILPTCLGLLWNGPISVAVAGYLYARGYATTMIWAAAAHTIAWLAVGLGLYPSLGLIAIGWGSLASAVVDSAVLAYTLKRATGISCTRIVAGPFAWGVAVSIGGYGMGSTLPPSWAQVIGCAALAGAVYLGGMAVFQPSSLADLRTAYRRLRTR